MQMSCPYEGQTVNTVSEYNHHLMSKFYDAHITFCGEKAEIFNVKAGGTYITLCTIKGFNPLLPHFNTLRQILEIHQHLLPTCSAQLLHAGNSMHE
jgi:hypothetical protein